MKKFLILLFVPLMLVNCGGCSNKNKEINNPLIYKDYIHNFRQEGSTEYLSVTSVIDILLTQKISEETKEKINSLDIFEFSPSVKGRVELTENNHLLFYPEKPFEYDTQYIVSVYLSKIFDDIPSNTPPYRFIVKTHKDRISVSIGALQSYNKDLYYLEGEITSNNQLTKEKVLQTLSATMDGKSYPIKTTENKGVLSTRLPFIVDSIPATFKGSTLKINWKDDGEEKSSDLSIPARDVFSPISAYISYDDRNTIIVNFSKPLKEKQNFDGLVTLDGDVDYYYIVNGNILKIVLKSALIGTYNLTVNEGIQSTYGNRLEKSYDYKLSFSPLNPEIKWVRNGTILPDSKNLKINFQAVNLKAVNVKVYRIFENNILQFLQEGNLNSSYELHRVASPIVEKRIILGTKMDRFLSELNSYSIDLANIIKPQPGAIYRVELSYQKEYALTQCGEEETVLEPYEKYDFEDDEDNDYYYDYNWEERDNPCSDSYYYDREISTNVLASNLGVIVKKGQTNQYTVIVNNINSTEPVSDALVEIYDFQQQKVGESSTSGEGIAQIKTSKEGYFVVVKKDKNTTYTKIDNGLALSVSNFNVGGTKLQKGLNGYIYTERGVWRPGDHIHLGFILNDFENKIPKGLPIKLTFKDPYGKIIQQKVQMSNPNNHYTFILSTEENAVTGNWQAEIAVGSARFYKSIKIETIKPNRLKILNNIEGKTLSKNGGKIEWDIQWLQGLPASNVKVETQVKFTRTNTEFKGYNHYTFDNPFSGFEEYEYTLGTDNRTNEEGKLQLRFKPELQDAPGMLNVYFLTKANERGGDFSTDVSSAKYSPYSTYAGIRPPTPNKNKYYYTNQDHIFDVVCVNEDGKPVANQKLDVLIFKTRWSWWWDASSQNMSNFTSSTRRDLYATADLVTNHQGKASISLNIPKADWGRYVILVTNPKNNQTSAISAYFDWEDWYSRSYDNNSREATMLMVSSEKDTYNVKERAKIIFPSNEGGRALISVENGSKVLQTDWIVTQQGETSYELPITDEMTPNIYVNVTLLQPHSATENDSPIRMYGVVPINVEDANTRLVPQVQMADILRPEQETTIKVKEKNGKPMTYTLAIVEDGLLDLTRFRTPNAWNAFFAKTALGVRTWDIYNDVIGAYGGKINQVFAIGGDENLAGAKAQKANRFAPLVIFDGPFSLGKNDTKTHKIKLPNYVGSARVMVIASDVEKNAYGSSEKTVPVRSPLMVLGSLPRKAVPGEKITLPVTVFAIEKNIKDVKLHIETNDKLKIKGKTEQQLSFSEPSEKMAYFNLEIGNKTGISKVKIVAVSGKEKAVYEVELDVYNPNPVTYHHIGTVLSKGLGETLNWEVFGASGTNQTTLEVSNFPGVNLSQRMGYLLAYPHGCSEQITSQAFPQLYLANFENLSEEKNNRIQRNINSAISKLFERQLSNGGFAYWDGGDSEDEWVTSYIGNFMLEAEKKGYALPPSSKNNWINYQQSKARSWRYNARYHNDILQAYRLYTLALANQADMASMNRLREISTLSYEAKVQLATAYALAGQRKIAQSLINQPISEDDKSFGNYYYGSPTRNHAIELISAITLKNKNLSAKWALEIASELSSNKWLSTQTTAFALVAMAQYIEENKSAPIDISITYNKKQENLKTSEPMLSKSLPILQGEQQLFIKNNSGGTAYVNITTSGILPIGSEFVQQEGLQLDTKFKDKKGNRLQPSQIKQGTEFIAEISVTNITSENVDNIALTQLIPSGWEIINMRYTNYGGVDNQVDYTDIRDDRTNFYFSLGAGKTKVFQIILNASYLGKYYLPGTYAEAMYNHAYNSRTQGEWVEVVE